MISQQPRPATLPGAPTDTLNISPETVQELLEPLLGRKVMVRKPLPSEKPSPRTVTGIYCADDGSVQSLCTLDLGLGAHAAAALTLFPARFANEAIAKGELPESLLENLQEILNICAQFTNELSSRHVALREVSMANRLPPDAAAALAKTPGLRLDLHIGIEGYGSGRFTLRKLN
jgi:hypothetical protein